jgi:phage terminase small subunit
MADKRRINPAKVEMFCQYFAASMNMSDAARKTGYSLKKAPQAGHFFLKREDVQQRVKELVNEKLSRQNITKEGVLDEIAAIAFSNVANYSNWGTRKETQRTVSKSGKVTETDTTVPFVDVYPSEGVDARAIKSIGMTNRGIKVELHDKSAALGVFARYFKIVEGEQTDGTAWQNLIKAAYDLSQSGKPKNAHNDDASDNSKDK